MCQAGGSRWRKVAAVMCDESVSKDRRGKMCKAVVRAAELPGVDAVTLWGGREAGGTVKLLAATSSPSTCWEDTARR